MSILHCISGCIALLHLFCFILPLSVCHLLPLIQSFFPSFCPSHTRSLRLKQNSALTDERKEKMTNGFFFHCVNIYEACPKIQLVLIYLRGVVASFWQLNSGHSDWHFFCFTPMCIVIPLWMWIIFHWNVNNKRVDRFGCIPNKKSRESSSVRWKKKFSFYCEIKFQWIILCLGEINLSLRNENGYHCNKRIT